MKPITHADFDAALGRTPAEPMFILRGVFDGCSTEVTLLGHATRPLSACLGFDCRLLAVKCEEDFRVRVAGKIIATAGPGCWALDEPIEEGLLSRRDTVSFEKVGPGDDITGFVTASFVAIGHR